MGAAMPISPSCQIHPTAIISSEADLAEGVIVGPYVVIDGPVSIGEDCVIKPHAYLVGPMTMGKNNLVFSGAVLGERPQHLRFGDEQTSLSIGDNNIFRENVTVHRGTTQSWQTRIGDNNFFMAGSHIAHDCQIGNRCIFANNALLGGHCELADNVFLSGNSAVQQFCRIGRLAFLSGCSATAKDIPPFIIQQDIDTVVGINVIGMRRAGMGNDQINAIRVAFKYIFRQGLTLPEALKRIDEQVGSYESVQELVGFLQGCKKGINAMRGRRRDAA